MKAEQAGQYVLRIALIERLHMDRTRASNMASGVHRPTLDVAAQIEEALGIPARAWATGNPRLEAWKLALSGHLVEPMPE